MRKLGVEEWLVLAVVSMYTGAKSVVITVCGNSSGFEVKVGIRGRLPWELLYADDLVVIAETEEDLIKRLNEWKNNVENRGMRVNMNKTKVMISGVEASAEGCKMAVWCMWQICW